MISVARNLFKDGLLQTSGRDRPVQPKVTECLTLLRRSTLYQCMRWIKAGWKKAKADESVFRLMQVHLNELEVEGLIALAEQDRWLLNPIIRNIISSISHSMRLCMQQECPICIARHERLTRERGVVEEEERKRREAEEAHVKAAAHPPPALRKSLLFNAARLADKWKLKFRKGGIVLPFAHRPRPGLDLPRHDDAFDDYYGGPTVDELQEPFPEMLADGPTTEISEWAMWKDWGHRLMPDFAQLCYSGPPRNVSAHLLPRGKPPRQDPRDWTDAAGLARHFPFTMEVIEGDIGELVDNDRPGRVQPRAPDDEEESAASEGEVSVSRRR